MTTVFFLIRKLQKGFVCVSLLNNIIYEFAIKNKS